MKSNCFADESKHSLLESISRKNKQKCLAAAASTTEVLTKLNVSIDALPPKCQQHLSQIAKAQSETDIEQIDSIAISLHQSKLVSEQLNDEYELLKLKQKDKQLQAKIDRNNKFMDKMREELDCSKSSLMQRNPNPETIQEVTRQLKLKVASYAESCENAKAKYSKLPVPEQAMPKSIVLLAETLASAKAEAARLQSRAEDVKLASEARHTLSRLMR